MNLSDIRKKRNQHRKNLVIRVLGLFKEGCSSKDIFFFYHFKEKLPRNQSLNCQTIGRTLRILELEGIARLIKIENDRKKIFVLN